MVHIEIIKKKLLFISLTTPFVHHKHMHEVYKLVLLGFARIFLQVVYPLSINE